MKLVLLHLSLLCALCGACAPGAAQEHSAAQAPPNAAIEQNDSGVEFMNQNLFREAAGAFRGAFSTDPSFKLARVNLGIALFYDLDLDAALRTLSEAEATEPANPYVLFTLALAYKRKGEIGKALEYFAQVLQIDPTCSASHYNLGVLYARQGKEKEAETALRRALELDPNQAGALYNLGTLLAKLGRRAEGNRMLEQYRVLQAKKPPQSGMGSGTGYGDLGRYSITQKFQEKP